MNKCWKDSLSITSPSLRKVVANRLSCVNHHSSIATQGAGVVVAILGIILFVYSLVEVFVIKFM